MIHHIQRTRCHEVGVSAAEPLLFGAAYSVYVRSVRLALAEKQVRYRLIEVDIFAPKGPPPDYLERQPFGRIPAFEHDGFRLYETGAIIRYVDEAFDGPALQPSDPRGRARMNQALSILDNYAYRTLVWDIYVERVDRPAKGQPADEQRIAQALRRARTCLAALEDLLAGGPWFAGADLSLADLHAAPMLTLLRHTPEGLVLLGDYPRLGAWWAAIRDRPSMATLATT